MSNEEGRKFKVLYCTTSSIDEATKIAEHLVGNHIVACVNVVPSVRSIFWWNNKVYQDNEALMIIKTEERHIPAVEQSIRLLHSYENPELISIPVEYSIAEYGKWMHDAVSMNSDG